MLNSQYLAGDLKYEIEFYQRLKKTHLKLFHF